MAITALPTEVLSLVLSQLCLVRNIKGVKRTCRAFRDAAPAAEQAHRRVCFEHADMVYCAAAAPDGRVIAGSSDRTVMVWRDGACERTIEAHGNEVRAVAVLPGGARFVSVFDETAKLWMLDGALERTFEVGGSVYCVAALPDGVHFVVGLGIEYWGEVRLYLSLIHI